MPKIGKIGIVHVIFIVMTCIGLKNHVTILPPLLEHVKRDGWMSVILAAILLIPWLFLLIFIHNKSNQQTIMDWLEVKIGKVASTILLYMIGAFLLTLAAFSLRETTLWMTSTFLPNTPTLILLIIYIILCFLLATTNLQTIVIVNTLVLMFVVVFGFYVAIANLQVKDYSLLRPFFEHGYSPILKGIIYPASGFIELFLLLFIKHHFKKLKWHHFVIMIVLLGGLTIGPLIGAIAEFGPAEAAKQRYPAYEEWALVTLGRFIEHMDFLSIYQWLTGTFIRVGLLLFITCTILNINGKRDKIWSYLVPPFFIINLILLLMDDSLFLEINGHSMLIFTFIFFLTLSVLFGILGIVTNKKTNKKTNTKTSRPQKNQNTESSDTR